MKIKVEDILEPVTINISGAEAWLAGIYRDFPHPEGQEEPKMVGVLSVIPETSGHVRVEGSIAYQPYIACSRCAEPMQWSIVSKTELTFKAPPTNTLVVKDRKLRKEELDEHFFVDGQIDLEVVVNEEIQLALPEQTVKRSDDGQACPVCQENETDTLIFKCEGEGEAMNPFAVLKNLNL